MVSGGNLCNIEGTTGITLNSGEGHWFRSSNRPSFVGGYLQRTCDTTMVHASFPRNVARKVQSSQVQGYFHHLERLMIHWCSNNWGYIGYMSNPLRCDQDEAAAVLCRCARSFWRVGHVELFARRSSSTELMDFLWHVFRRDFPELVAVHRRLDDLIMAFFQEFVQQQAELVAEWLRVGYVHGNMNSDNCLLCGQTLDYGPFAFMEGYLVAGLSFKYVLLLLSISQQTAGWSNFQFVWAGSTYCTRYDPSYQPFTSDKTGHYAFDQQPAATLATVRVLAENIVHALPAKEQGGCAEHLKKITAAWFIEKVRRKHLRKNPWTSWFLPVEHGGFTNAAIDGSILWDFRDRNWEFHESELGM